MGRVICFFLFFLTHLCSAELISLKGYLGHDELDPVRADLQTIEYSSDDAIFVRINSSAGEFDAVYQVAELLTKIRMEQGRRITVFIQSRAIGPAAILPFIADEIYVTPNVVWGDIPYTVKETKKTTAYLSKMTKQLLTQNQVKKSYFALADSMIDPHRQIQGSDKGFEPLVLNYSGMKSHGLISQTLTELQFFQTYFPDLSQDLDTDAVMDDEVYHVMSAEELHAQFRRYIKVKPVGENLIGFINLVPDYPIDQMTYVRFKFALSHFADRNVACILLNINSGGGDTFSTLRIAKLLQEFEIATKIPIIAYIDPWAIASAAILPYSAQFIAVNSSSIMGVSASETRDAYKAFSSETVRREFTNIASLFGRNPLLADAMIDPMMTLVLRDGQIKYLPNADQILKDDIIITKPGHLFLLTGPKLIDYGIADFIVKSEVQDASQTALISAGKWPASSSAIFAGEPYLAEIPNAFLIGYDSSWLKPISILTTPSCLAFFLCLFLLAFYLEIQTPGFTLFGAIGFISCALMVVAGNLMGTLSWLNAIVLSLGLILLLLELFVIPGFGWVGLTGILLSLLSLIGILLPGLQMISLFDSRSWIEFYDAIQYRLFFLLGGIAFAIIISYFIAKIAPKKYQPLHLLFLRRSGKLPPVGAKGRAYTSLEPEGKVLIEEKIYNAIAEGDSILKDAPIIIVALADKTLIVAVDSKNKS